MAEDDARAYVLAFESNKNEAADIAARAASRLQNGQVKLVDVIKATGEFLQSTDIRIRERATHYLSAIIEALPSKALSRHDVPVLNVFLCSRIQDGGSIQGLSRLQSLERYTQENARELAQAIFDNFTDMSEKKQSERYQVYLLLNELLSNHRAAMLGMGDRSLLGFIQVVGGEKDPRNLMLIFSMIRVLMIEWDITQHVDMMFDSVYAYFPITFRPPPHDPYGITAQDLKDRLKDCLAATGELAPSVFPNLLERLDSTSEAVKKDVLQALAACALHYDPITMSSFSISLWDAVKFEVLQAQDSFLADEALLVFKNIAACLSRKTSPHAPNWKADHLIHFLKPVNKECLEHLQEPASRQAGASADILKAVASATVRSGEVVFKAVGPALITLQQSSEGINNQRAILGVVNKLLEASLDVYGSATLGSDRNPEAHLTLLAEFKDKLLAIYSRALMSTIKEEVSYRLAALRGLLLLSQQRNLLDENEVGLVVQHLNDIVLDEESYSRDELKQKAMQALADISVFKPRLITDITFPKFIARLPEGEDDAQTKHDYREILEGLAQISIGRELLETVLRRLLNKLDVLLQTSIRQDYPYTRAVLSTVYFIFNQHATDNMIDLDAYFARVVVNFSQKAAYATQGPLIHDSILDLVGRLANIITRHATTEHQQQAAENIYTLFRPDMNDAGDVSRTPSHALAVSTWLLAAVPKSSRDGIVGQPIPPLLSQLRVIAVNEKDDEQTAAAEQACLKQITLLVNKHISSTEQFADVDRMFDDSYVQACNLTKQAESQALWRSNVRLMFSLAKGLVLRLAPSTTKILTSCVELLSRLHPERAKFVAAGFGTLLLEDSIISKQNQAQIRMLAPQKVFQTLVPMFSNRFRDTSATQESREVYLVALSGILGTVSSSIIMPELPSLLPLLLQSLELSHTHQNVKIATLQTLTVVITKNPDALIDSGHLAALSKKLISAAKPPDNHKYKQAYQNEDVTMTDRPSATSTSSPRVRQLALHCLGLLPVHVKDQKLPNPLIMLKGEVLNSLSLHLDDPRRDVRKEAVDARARWLRNIDDVEDDGDE